MASTWMTLAHAGKTVVEGRTFGKRYLAREAKAGRLRVARIGAKGELFTRLDWMNEWLESQSTPIEVFRRRQA